MQEADYKSLAIAEIFIAFAGSLFLVSGLLPGTYGLYQWLGDNGKLAPWISGAATSAGVIVALWNSHRQIEKAAEKELRDEERERLAAAQRKADRGEAAGGVLARIFASAEALQENIGIDKMPWVVIFGEDSFPLVEFQLGDRILQKYRIEEIQNSQAVECWHKIELFHLEILRTLSQAVKITEEPDSTIVNQTIDSICRDCGRIMRLINDFRTFVKLEPFKVDLKLSPGAKDTYYGKKDT